MSLTEHPHTSASASHAEVDHPVSMTAVWLAPVTPEGAASLPASLATGLPARASSLDTFVYIDGSVPPAALELLMETASHVRAPCYLYDCTARRLIWTNDHFRAVFGAIEVEASLADFVQPSESARLAERHSCLVHARDGEIIATEWQLRTTTGAWRRYRLQETVLARTYDGSPRLVVGLAQELVGRSPSQRSDEVGLERFVQIAISNASYYAAEREQRRLFEAALAHLPLATAILDGPSLSIRWANPAFQEFVDDKYREADMTGLGLADVMAHAGASGLAEIVRKVAATGRPCSDLRYVYQGPHSAARYWRFSLQPLPGEGGELMLHVEDVTGSMRGQPGAGSALGSTPVRIKH